MTKGYSYIRFSTPEQGRGDSFRRQLEGAREFARDHDIDLDESLRDLGKSAFKGGHARTGALARFLRLVEENVVAPGSYLIVESLDRLSREEVIDAASRLLALINAGIHVVTLSDRQIYSRDSVRDNWTLLILSLSVMARAHEESRVKSHRLGKAWTEKRRRAAQEGQAMTRIAPAWIRLVGDARTGRYELIPERAEIVRGIFRDTIAGLGRRTIARALNDARVEPWGAGGKRGLHWHDSYIQKIVNNPATFGQFESLGKLAGGTGEGAVLIPNYYPSVIDEVTFYRAQAAARHRASPAGRASEAQRNLLRGVAKCAECGGNMVIVDKGARSSGPKLICGAARVGAGCTHRIYYPYSIAETGVVHAVGGKRMMPKADDRTRNLIADADGVKAQRADTRKRLDNLVELVASGGRGATVAGQIAQLEDRLQELDRRTVELDREIKMSAPRADDAGQELMALYGMLASVEGEELARVRTDVNQRLAGLVERIVFEDGRAVLVMRGGGHGGEIGFGSMIRRPVPRVTKLTKEEAAMISRAKVQTDEPYVLADLAEDGTLKKRRRRRSVSDHVT